MNEACTQAELGWTLGHFQVLGRVNVNFCVHGPQRGVTRRHQKKALQSFWSLRLRCVFILSSLCLHCVFILSLRLWPLCLHCFFTVSSSCLHCVFILSSLCLHCVFTVFTVSSFCLYCVFTTLAVVSVFTVSSFCLHRVFTVSSLSLYDSGHCVLFRLHSVFIVSLRLWLLCLHQLCLHSVFNVSLRLWPLCLYSFFIVSSLCLYDSGHCVFIVSSLCLHSVITIPAVSETMLQYKGLRKRRGLAESVIYCTEYPAC